MDLSFTKMHSLGNDFVLFDAIDQKIQLSVDQIRAISHRQLGIGCDQIILLESSLFPTVDFYYRIYNADGTEAEQCGNGVRCAAQFFAHSQKSYKSVLFAESKGGITTLQILDQNTVTAVLAAPTFDLAKIPCLIKSNDNETIHRLSIDEMIVNISILSVGNPHAVLIVDDINTYPVHEVGAKLSQHPFFPKGINVEFMQIINNHTVALRVYERGVGETYACGSGACSAVIAGIQQGLLSQQVTAAFSLGALVIKWHGGDIQMTGTTTMVFEGNIKI